MLTIENIQKDLIDFLETFNDLAGRFDHTINNCSELERLIDNYSRFITNDVSRNHT